MKPLANSEIAAATRETRAKFETRTPGVRTYPPMRSVDLLGGHQVVGYDHAAEVRSASWGTRFAGTWSECIAYAIRIDICPAHLS